MDDWVLDLVEILFRKEAVVADWAMWISDRRLNGRQNSISIASGGSVLAVDLCMFLGEELWKLKEFMTSQSGIIRQLDVPLQITSNNRPERLRLNEMWLSRWVSMSLSF